jgi:hypothetical protein
LGGNYKIQILQDNLSDEEAEELEANWIAQCADSLVNWVNAGRPTDFSVLAECNRLRDANRALIESAKHTERTDLEAAASMYVRAIEAISSYVTISYEKGLVAQLLEEESAEQGINGELEALDRLSLCLTRLGRPEEAASRADQYFALYRRDLRLAASERITKRIEKARSRTAARGLG